MQEDLYKSITEILKILDKDKKIFMDNLRKNLGIGYSSDTNVYLKILGFNPCKERKREKLTEWYKNTLQVMYFTQFYEIVKVFTEYENELKFKELKERDCTIEYKKIEEMKNRFVTLINRPNVRLVMNETYDFKSLDQDLYKTLLNEFNGLSNDMKIALSASYEGVPLLTFDLNFESILFRNNLPRIDSFKPLPYEYKGKWIKSIKQKEEND